MIPANHLAAYEQWRLPYEEGTTVVKPSLGELVSQQNNDGVIVSGKDFKVVFSSVNGEITMLEYNGKNIIKEGLQANFWRGLTDNDVANGTPERCRTWKDAGNNARLDDLSLLEKNEFGNAVVSALYTLEEQAAKMKVTYEIRPEGVIKVTNSFIPGDKELPEMPRLGMRMILLPEYEEMTWYG